MLRQLRVVALWGLGLLAAFFLVSLVQGLGAIGDEGSVAPALPGAAAPAPTRVFSGTRLTPTPPLSYVEARQRLRTFAATLKHDNLVSGSTPDRERTVALLEGIEALSVELDRLRSAPVDRSGSSDQFARVQRDMIIMAGVVSSFLPLFEASHDRYMALVGHLQLLHGSMTALVGVLRFERQLQQSTPQS